MATTKSKLSLFNADGTLLIIPPKDRKKIYLDAAELSYEIFEEYARNSSGQEFSLGMCITTAIILTENYDVEESKKLVYDRLPSDYWDSIKSINKTFLFWEHSEKFLPELSFMLDDNNLYLHLIHIRGYKALNFRIGLLSLCAALCDDEDFQNSLKRP